MPDTTTRAHAIRAELDKLAPRPNAGEPGSAAALALHLAMEAQIVWARLMTRGSASGPGDAGLLGAYFAAGCALDSLAMRDPARADGCAAEIVRRWDDGLSAGDWVWEHLGGDAVAVAKLAQELAETTAVKS